MSVTGKEPYRSRADLSRALWAPYFAAVRGFTFDSVGHAPWVRHVEKAFPKEGTGRAHGLTLAMIPLLLALEPQAKWYFLVDDDTFVVPHQLLQAALAMNHSELILAGRCATYDPLRDHPAPNESKLAVAGVGPDDIKPIEFVVGGGGILASRAFVEALAAQVQDCRRRFNFHGYGDTRVAACGRHVLKHTAFVTCRQSEFFNDGPLEAIPSRSVLPDQKVRTMHIKNPSLFKLLFRYLERNITERRDITWSNVVEVAGLLKPGVH